MSRQSIPRSPLWLPLGGAQRALVAALIAVGLAGCGDYGGGGGSGGFVERQTLDTSSNATSETIFEFSQTVYPIVRDNCADCHGGSGPGSPQIAHVDVTAAYYAVLGNQKVSFVNPVGSRLVQRLASDQHYCWSNCTADGAVMTVAIETWAQLAGYEDGSQVTAEVLASGEAQLSDGEVQEQPDRYVDGAIALWEFKEGTGPTAFDTSGVDPAMDLTVDGAEWMSNYGLNFLDGRAYAEEDTSFKLWDYIAAPATGSQAFSIEAWITNANTDQEGVKIFTYAQSTGNTNFSLSQQGYQYDLRTRNVHEEVNNSGRPQLLTYDVDRDAQATLQHIVMTYDQFRGRRLYVNGLYTDDVDEAGVSRLWNWNPNYDFVLGQDADGDDQWLGKIQLVAIFNKVLSQTQISQNYDAGIGKKVKVSFDVTSWVGVPSSIDFVVSVFDDYSYLFCEPTFHTDAPNGLRIKNLQIQVNGTTPVSGQAFKTLDAQIFTSGQVLSRQCSLIQQDLGSGDLDPLNNDVFAIRFEVLGELRNEIPPPNMDTDISIVDATVVPGEGLRNYHQINASFAEITGVDPNLDAVDDVFNELQQQLPSSNDPRTFVSSHQIGIAKLSLEYCDALVDDDLLRPAFFPDFDFTQAPEVAFDTQGERDDVILPLLDKSFSDVTNQPNAGDSTALLNDLITDLTDECVSPGDCPPERTSTVVKAVCSAVLSSGAVAIY